MIKPVWKPIPGYDKFYEASTDGHIRRIGKSQVLTPSTNNIGYHRVCMHVDNGKQINKYVSRLIAVTFVPNPDNKSEVNHINGIKTDNRACNLEWSTRSENETHAYQTGLASVGSAHSQSKISEEDVKRIRQLRAEGYLLRQLSSMFKLSESTLSSICHRQIWKHVD